MSATVSPQTVPYELVGGHKGVRRIVDRFYDLMESEPAFAALRALHAPDLSPMRRSLSGFLTGWMGGPRDWFADNPGKCMMSLHASVGVDPLTAGQWVDAMRRALADSGVDPDLAARLDEAFTAMAFGMIRPR